MKLSELSIKELLQKRAYADGEHAIAVKYGDFRLMEYYTKQRKKFQRELERRKSNENNS